MENEEVIPINIIREGNNNKKIKVKFQLIQEQTEKTYECNENEKIKDKLSQFINDNQIEKELKDAYLLYEGGRIEDDIITFNQIKNFDKEDIITILVNFKPDDMNSVSLDNDDQRGSLLMINDSLQPEENPINACNLYDKFICILKSFPLIFCCYKDLENLYFVKINRTLLYQSFIIGIVNYIDYYHEWNKIYIESSRTIKITFFIVSLIVGILYLGFVFLIYFVNEKIRKYILYFYHFLYIPIIIFYCFLLASIFKKDYILCITVLIITINFASTVCSLLLYFGNCEGYIFIYFIIFDSLLSILNLYFTFKYWDEVNEGKINIILITIAYNIYIVFCMGFSYVKFRKEGYEFGIVIADYLVLFPIAIAISVILLFSILTLSCFFF